MVVGMEAVSSVGAVGAKASLCHRMVGGAWEQWALGFPPEQLLANPGGTYFTLIVKCLQILSPPPNPIVWVEFALGRILHLLKLTLVGLKMG